MTLHKFYLAFGSAIATILVLKMIRHWSMTRRAEIELRMAMARRDLTVKSIQRQTGVWFDCGSFREAAFNLFLHYEIIARAASRAEDLRFAVVVKFAPIFGTFRSLIFMESIQPPGPDIDDFPPRTDAA